MKIFWIVLGVIALGLAINALVNYLLQRTRQQRAEREGLVVYASVVSMDAMGGLAKYAQMKKVVLRIQEPGVHVPREVTLRTRLPPGQKFTAGMKVAVAVDPKNAKRVYPAGPEAQKRIQITGSRLERRHLKPQNIGRQQQPPQRYQPPIKTGRR